MHNIVQEGSFKLPSISFNADSGVLEIEGKSIPERTAEFYDPLVSWIDEYAKSPNETTTLNIKLEYCNSSSTRYVMDILERFEGMFKAGKNVIINWHYEEDDEDMLDLGESYSVPLTVEINMIADPID
ncbi:MAG: DUF1987 domain-containing protein [Flavobacteriales bacterium]|nr:DUF1987 domain-containing protein [Flavobacteriales bacterium]